jgi:hypothetical protein
VCAQAASIAWTVATDVLELPIAAMALVGVAGAVGVGGMGYLLWQNRPKDPKFEVVGMELSGFKLRWMTESFLPYAVLDVSMKLSIKVTNPNITPIQYTATTMDIFYRGTLMGQAQVEAGSQGAQCDQVIEIPAKLDGLKITEHVKELFQDVAKREMQMSAVVTIAGDAIVWKIRHHFEVKVNSDITVDPVFLKVLDQDNRAEMQLAAFPEIESREAEKGEEHAQTAGDGEIRDQTEEKGEKVIDTTN